MSQGTQSPMGVFIEECRKTKVTHEQGLQMFRAGTLSLMELTAGGSSIDISHQYIATLERMIAELDRVISAYEAEHHG